MPNTKKIILPYELNVESIAYQTQAFPLGIVKANVADYNRWLCNKCINFFLPAYSKLFSVYEEDLWSSQDGLMTFCEKKFAPETFHSECSKIVEENKYMLDNGYYIFGVYNEFYIPQKKAYYKRDFMHGYIIFGYDDASQVFKSAGYLADGHYRFFDINYEDYYKSIIGGDVGKLWIRYYKVNHNYKPQIDINHLKSRLVKYLKSQRDTYSENDHSVYGMEALDKFRHYITSSVGSHLDFRCGRIYMEHKYMMYKRLVFLFKNFYIKDEYICNKYFKEIYLESKIVFNLFMKYNITGNCNILDRISNIVSVINKTEKNIIETLSKSLKPLP